MWPFKNKTDLRLKLKLKPHEIICKYNCDFLSPPSYTICNMVKCVYWAIPKEAIDNMDDDVCAKLMDDLRADTSIEKE